jgi:outer membrane protein OmpA-like peptidoglycan-associated protein
MKIQDHIFLSIAFVGLSGSAFATNMPAGERAELGAVIYKYNFGDVVGVSIQPNQHVICDSCPKTRLLAEYKEPAVSKLKLNSMPTSSPQKVASAPPSETPKEIAAAPTVQVAPPVEKDLLLATIHFKLDSYKLDTKANEEIDRVASELKKQHGNEVIIKVDGYTCKLGTKKHNDNLAMNRAKAVAEGLKRHGIIVTQTTGEGVCCYSDKEHLEPNRRVEIMEAKSKGGK